jgi:hypothetical protein
MTLRNLLKTRSGCPGNSRECSLYRYPREKTSRRTSNSGRVSLARTRAILSDRSFGDRVSTRLSPLLSPTGNTLQHQSQARGESAELRTSVQAQPVGSRVNIVSRLSCKPDPQPPRIGRIAEDVGIPQERAFADAMFRDPLRCRLSRSTNVSSRTPRGVIPFRRGGSQISHGERGVRRARF